MKKTLIAAATAAFCWSLAPAFAAGAPTSSGPSGITAADTPDLTISGWHWRRPSTNANPMNDVTFTHGRFVMVGNHGTIRTASDGVNWTERSSGTTEQLMHVSEAGDKVIAVGSTGTVVVSDDGGLSWTVRATGAPIALTGAAFGNARYLAVGQDGMLTSTDAVTWTAISPGSDVLQQFPVNVLFALGQFYLTTQTGDPLRSTDGVHWDRVYTGLGTDEDSGLVLDYANGVMVAISGDGAVVTSTDGTNWVQRRAGSYHFSDLTQMFQPARLIYDGTKFVSTGTSGNGDKVLTSADGKTWTIAPLRHPAFGLSVTRFAYGAGVYVAVAPAPANYTSTDAVTWKGNGTPANVNAQFVSVLSTPSGFIAYSSSKYAYRSSNGVDWTQFDTGLQKQIGEVKYLNGHYISFGYSFGISSDGITWSETALPANKTFASDIAHGNSRYVAVGFYLGQLFSGLGNPAAMTSTDGVSWTAVTIESTAGRLSKVIYDGTRFVAAGVKGRLYVSTDGLSWTPQTMNVDAYVDQIAFNGTAYAATLHDSQTNLGLYVSTDLATWTAAAAPKPASQLTVADLFMDLDSVNGRFIAATRNGLVYLSADGISWTMSDSGQQSGNGAGGALAYGNQTLVLVTSSGVILQSDPVFGLGLTGASTTPSTPATPAAAGDSRLVNLSTSGPIHGADGRLTGGFVLAGGQPKRVLLRGVGPALAAYGLTGLLANPRIQVMDSTGTKVAENDDWAATDELNSASATAGAFPLPAGSRDAAVVATLAPGAYTFDLSGVSPDVNGRAMVEIYEASTSDELARTGPIHNVSTRGTIGAAGETLVGGFVIAGNAPKRVLIRGVGPELIHYGVSQPLADPVLDVFSGSTSIAHNDNWDATDATDVAAAAAQAGAFALSAGGRDAAVVLTLAPGAYTVQLSGANGGTGEAMVEIYELSE